MKKFLKVNSLYISLYLFTLCCALYFILRYDKLIIHQMINWWVGHPVANFVYKYITHLGDGVFAVLLGILILPVSVKKGLYVLLTYASAGITSAIIKHSVNYTRPYAFFDYYKKHLKLNIVEGIEMLGERSFPSGHATAAFAVFTALAFCTESRFLKFVFLVIAVNAAFSRVYLSQHWLFDVFIGSLIGFLYAVLLYFVFYDNTKIDNRLDRFKIKK